MKILPTTKEWKEMLSIPTQKKQQSNDPATSTDSVDTQCKNCGYVVSSNFCSNCGQTVNTPRITGKMMWREFLRVYINLDKGLIFTLKRMLFNPGLAPLDYVQGKRISYMKPLTFVAIALAGAKAAVKNFKEDFDPYFDIREVPETWVSMILVGTVVTKMFIRDKRYNFWEVLTLQVFIHFVFIVATALLAFFVPNIMLHDLFYSIPPLYAMYICVAYWEFFDLKTLPQMTRAAVLAAFQTILLISLMDN
jgi:hypothetical protein